MKQRIKQSIILLSIGVAVNVALAITKMYVGISVNSLCITLDGTNSLFDVLTGIITVIAFAALFAPRSENAPFGYGRSEYLAGFIVAVVSAVMGGLFFMRSLNRLAMPEPVWFGWQSCVIIAVAIPVKLAIGLLYYFYNKKLQSKAIAAIVVDSFLDVGITSASLISFAVSGRADYAVDAIFGIVISVIVVVFAIIMVCQNLKCVVKGDDCEDEREAITKYLAGCEYIRSAGEIVLHDYGFGARTGTVRAVFASDVTREDMELLERKIYEDIEKECGAKVWIIPMSAESEQNSYVKDDSEAEK